MESQITDTRPCAHTQWPSPRVLGAGTGRPALGRTRWPRGAIGSPACSSARAPVLEGGESASASVGEAPCPLRPPVTTRALWFFTDRVLGSSCLLATWLPVLSPPGLPDVRFFPISLGTTINYSPAMRGVSVLGSGTLKVKGQGCGYHSLRGAPWAPRPCLSTPAR